MCNMLINKNDYQSVTEFHRKFSTLPLAEYETGFKSKIGVYFFSRRKDALKHSTCETGTWLTIPNHSEGIFP